jgi:hypothetical protein
MTIAEMMEQSLVLTVLGMTVVFVFLWIMIVCINWVGKLVHFLKEGDHEERPHYLLGCANNSGCFHGNSMEDCFLRYFPMGRLKQSADSAMIKK